MLLENISIQLGIDLATALSIIGATLTYVRSERIKRNEEINRDNLRERDRRVDLAYKVVDEILGFLPTLNDRVRIINKIALSVGEPVGESGRMVRPAAQVGQEIYRNFNELLDDVEFGLLRPLSVKIETVGGDIVWRDAYKKYEKSLSTIRKAFNSIYQYTNRPDFSEEERREAISQAVPLLQGKNAIGGEVETLYSSLIALSRDIKGGLLAKD